MFSLQRDQQRQDHADQQPAQIDPPLLQPQIQPVIKSRQVYFPSLGAGAFVHLLHFYVLSTTYLPVVVLGTRIERGGLRNLDFDLETLETKALQTKGL